MPRHLVLPSILCVLYCTILGAFLTDHDETLQSAFDAIQQLKTDNEQLRQRLQAAEASIAANGQTLNSLPGSRLLDDFVMFGDWVLAFRATKAIGVQTYETYIHKGHYDDDPATRGFLPCGCTTVNGSLPCDRHFRSRLLDIWPSAAIDQVRLVLYENGAEKAHMTFSGTGTDYVSWFSANRLVSSSWTDLTTTKAYSAFSVTGDNTYARRFEVATYNGCPGDVGWMVVKDVTSDVCSGITPQHIPTFYYASGSTSYKWQEQPFHQADVMAIFVKLRPNADLDHMCIN